VVEERELDFLQALWRRRVVITYVLFSLNILIFLLMEFSGGATNEATLMAFGVKSNAEINHGEIWRFVTPVFIHIGLLHLFFNSWALWVVGPQVEKLYGGARFFILYILTGVAGVYGSYWRHPESISAGASGAIFGLFGALLVFGIKYRNTIPPFFQTAVGKGVLPVIVINLIIGFSIPGIDNSAHIGGLIAGAALAAIIPYEHPGTSTHFVFAFIQAVLAIVVAASFYEVAAHYDGPNLSVPNLSRSWGQLIGSKSSIEDFVEATNNAQQALNESIDELSSISPMSRTIPRDLPRIRAELTKAIDELNHVPSVSKRADQMSRDLQKLAQSQYALVQNIERTGVFSYDDSRRAKENAESYNDVVHDFNRWVETEGERYGIQLRKQP
jgi:membrane associated rhomboid family serine protease